MANIFEPRQEISNNGVCATSKGSDQPAHTRSLIRAFASRLISCQNDLAEADHGRPKAQISLQSNDKKGLKGSR